jgi:tetratricopeptide (TPR) repeat protein
MSLETLSPEELLKQGQELEGRNKIKEAIKYYQEAQKRNPKLQGLHTSLGNALVKNKEPAKAIKAYKKAIDLHKEKYAYFNLGLLYFHLKMYSLAAEMLSEAERRGFHAPDTYYTLSKAYFLSKQFDEAEKILGKGFRKTSHPGLARALAKLKDRKGGLSKNYPGEQSLIKIIDKKPHELKNYNELFLHYMKENNFEAAEKILKKAVANNKQNLASWTNLAAYYFESAHFKEAADLLEKAILVNPKDTSDINYNFYVNLAQAYLALGEKKNAIKALQKLSKLNPPKNDLVEKMITGMKKNE